jgi:hypothetical protein
MINNDIFTKEDQNKYLGIYPDSFKKIYKNINIKNISLNNNQKISEEEIIIQLNNSKSPLDYCLSKIDISFDDEFFNIISYDNKPDITVAVLHDVLMMKLFPPRNSIIENNIINLPIFEIEYIIENLPVNANKYEIYHHISKSKNEWEGNILYEILNKAVRSQRNKIEKEINNQSINQAIELIERENENVDNILANTKAYLSEKETFDNLNIRTIIFSPENRVNKNRVYFMGASNILGKVAKSQPKIKIEKRQDVYNISCLFRIGIVILNRDVISVVEH